MSVVTKVEETTAEIEVQMSSAHDGMKPNESMEMMIAVVGKWQDYCTLTTATNTASAVLPLGSLARVRTFSKAEAAAAASVDPP